jgi:hypothetical protein
VKENPAAAAEHQLDWSIHARRSEWPTSAKLFLAEAVSRAGAALWDLWDNDLPGWLAHPKVPKLPDADEAFDRDTPIHGIHARFAPHIRKIITAAEYRALFEEEVPPTVILRWELEEDEEITRPHWEEAVRMSYEQAHEREFAEKVIADVSRLLGELVVSGRVRTFVRPLEGGQPQPMATSLWELNARIRIATCALNLDDPFTHSLPPTHHIFVEEEDLQRELASLPPDRKINPIPALCGSTLTRDEEDAFVKELLDWLSGMMEKPPEGTPWRHQNWRYERFANAATDRFGERYNESNFKRAYRYAQAKFPHFSKRGRPPKDDPTIRD